MTFGLETRQKTSVEQDEFARLGHDRVLTSARTPSEEGCPNALKALAVTLLRAIDEGTPAGDPARAFALAVLASTAPMSGIWRSAVEIIEGGPLRMRWAVMLAGEVLGDAVTH